MHRGVLLAVALMIGGGGCLYTDPINRPPMITIVPPSTTILRGGEAAFKYVASDPDSDPYTVAWVHETTRRCPKTALEYEDEKNWPQGERQTSTEYVVGPPDTDEPFCVWAFATDRGGATGVATPYQVDPGRQAPVAKIDVIDPAGATEYSLYAAVTLSAGNSIADGQATFSWLVTPPLGSAVTDLPCVALTDQTQACLSPDVPGNYVVSLTVANGDGATSTATETVRVLQDQLPCIEMTTPYYTASPVFDVADLRFRVDQVIDDGNPFPAPSEPNSRIQPLEFLWWHDDPNTKTLKFIGNDQSDYAFPGDEFSLGDEIRVRVEIRDRNKTEIDRIMSACGDQPVCGSSPKCLQRVTWTVRVP